MPRNGVSTASSGRVAHLDRVPASETGTLQAASRQRTELNQADRRRVSPRWRLGLTKLDMAFPLSASSSRRIRRLAKLVVAGAITQAEAEARAVGR